MQSKEQTFWWFHTLPLVLRAFKVVVATSNSNRLQILTKSDICCDHFCRISKFCHTLLVFVVVPKHFCRSLLDLSHKLPLLSSKRPPTFVAETKPIFDLCFTSPVLSSRSTTVSCCDPPIFCILYRPVSWCLILCFVYVHFKVMFSEFCQNVWGNHLCISDVWKPL